MATQIEEEAKTPLQHLDAARQMQELLAIPQPVDTYPRQHAVIQIKTGEYRGTLWLVGEVEGETVHCYRITPGGEKEFHETKFGEFHLISQVQKGMVAWKYEKPIKDKAPSWHEEDRTDGV